MKKEHIYREDLDEMIYATPKCWGVCFVDSEDNDYTFYPGLIFGDELDEIHNSSIRYVFSPDTAFRLGLKIIEYSLRCMWYKKKKKKPKSFKSWF